METRDYRLFDENGNIRLQIQWATGGGGVLAGAAVNAYEPEASSAPVVSAHLTVAQVKAMYDHLSAILEEHGELKR